MSLLDIQEVAPDEPRIEKPRLFGDFELIEQIGRGGMGVVYKARQRSLNRIVALKMLLHADTATREELERLQIEAETAANLRHPGIVPVFEFGEQDGRKFIAMDYIAGLSLAQHIAAKAYEWPQARDNNARSRARQLEGLIVRLVRDVARAVQHAHQSSVVHRDIKPSNILLDVSGRPFLTDFGIAKAMDGATSISESGVVRGTLSYMAPEQADGKQTGYPADVFSLGAVLYELLAGQAPFRASTFAETIRRLKETEPLHPRSICQWIGKDVATICLKCLEKDATRRYGSAGELADDLDRCVAHQPIKARRMGPLARTHRWVRRNPVGTALIVTLVGALAVSGVLLQEALRRSRQAMAAQKVMLNVAGENIAGFDQSQESQLIVISEVLAFYGAGTEAEQEFAYTWATLPKLERYRVGVTLYQAPLGTVLTYARLCLQIEKHLFDTLNRPVAFDLVVFKDPADLMKELDAGRLDFSRVTTQQFVESRRRQGKLRPIAQAGWSGDTMVLFARADASISNVAGLKGHELLLFSSHNDETALVKELLLAAGLTASDVVCRFVFDELRHANERIPFREFPELPNANARRTVFELVIDRGRYVAGLGTDELPLYRPQTDWVHLGTVETPRRLWVGGARLKSDVAAGLERALMAAQDPGIDLSWRKASPQKPVGFAPAPPSIIRRWEDIHEAARRFDAGSHGKPEDERSR